MQTTVTFTKTAINEAIKAYRFELYSILTAPVDAMWEVRYIAPAQHYWIGVPTSPKGYCSIDEDGRLLQLYLRKKYWGSIATTIQELVTAKLISSAKLSSATPLVFNACLELSHGVKADTYCYQHPNTHQEIEHDLEINLVTKEEIPQIKTFFRTQVGMDDTFGYTENLVSRKELFAVKQSGHLVATSECRMSDSQPEIADLGMIVHQDYRGQGIGSKVMKMQVNRVLDAGRKPICSTTIDNTASQRIIENAGFYCSNIIFDINLLPDQI